MTREMKYSGVEWIGDIPSEWRVENLQWNMTEIIEKNSSIKMKSVLSLTKEKGVIPYEDKGNQGNKSKESIEEYKIAYKDTIVANSMNILIGSVGISNYDGCVSPVYYVFKNNEKTDLRYLNYIFTTEQFQKQLRKYANGILEIRLRVSSENILKQKVMFPTLSEQKKIADFLDGKVSEIDKIIAETKSSIENYKEYKQSVITEAVTKGLDKNVPMKDSGIEWIGDIPSGWEIMKIKHIGIARNGLTYSPSEMSDSEIGKIVLRSSNIKNNRLSFEDNVYVSKNIPENLMIKKNDILICSRNGSKHLIGKNAIIENDISASFGAFMMIFRTKYNAKYIKYILDSNVFKYYLGTFLTATINQLTNDNFSNMKVVLCKDEKQQDKIVDYLDNRCAEIDNIISEKEKLISNLEEYKKSLIYEYVTGKRSVK